MFPVFRPLCSLLVQGAAVSALPAAESLGRCDLGSTQSLFVSERIESPRGLLLLNINRPLLLPGRQAGGQTGRQAGRQADRTAGRGASGRIERHEDKQARRDTVWQGEGQTDRQAERLSEQQAETE